MWGWRRFNREEGRPSQGIKFPGLCGFLIFIAKLASWMTPQVSRQGDIVRIKTQMSRASWVDEFED
jgi:hypothetical protein